MSRTISRRSGALVIAAATVSLLAVVVQSLAMNSALAHDKKLPLADQRETAASMVRAHRGRIAAEPEKRRGDRASALTPKKFLVEDAVVRKGARDAKPGGRSNVSTSRAAGGWGSVASRALSAAGGLSHLPSQCGEEAPIFRSDIEAA